MRNIDGARYTKWRSWVRELRRGGRWEFEEIQKITKHNVRKREFERAVCVFFFLSPSVLLLRRSLLLSILKTRKCDARRAKGLSFFFCRSFQFASYKLNRSIFFFMFTVIVDVTRIVSNDDRFRHNGSLGVINDEIPSKVNIR